MRDICIICGREVGAFGYDWQGGRAHGVCLIEDGRGRRLARQQKLVDVVVDCLARYGIGDEEDDQLVVDCARHIVQELSGRLDS